MLVFFAAVLVRLLYHYVTGFTADDAFITFRYAENIALGSGFVYNEGERVLGTSSPLFTMLLSLFAGFSVKPLISSLLVSLVSAGLTAVIIYRFACSLRLTDLAFVPVLMYILWARSVATDTSGMETAFFTLLVTSAFYYQHRRMFFYAVALATLAALTRPEGSFVLLLLVAYNCIRDRGNWFYYLVAPALLLGPWLLFSWSYFGTVLPHSVSAKLALYWSGLPLPSTWSKLVYLMLWHNPAGWALTVAVVLGAWWLNRKQNFGWLEIIWIVSMVVFYSLVPTRLFFWYVAPIYPLTLLIASASVPLVLNRIAWLTAPRRRAAGSVIAIVMTAFLLVGLYPKVIYYRNFQTGLETIHKEVGTYLYRTADRSGDSAALEDIGYAGYYSKMHIIDRDGLISPDIVPYNLSGGYLDAVLDLKPEWVGLGLGSPISAFRHDSTYVNMYRLKRCFPDHGDPVYCLYQRIEQSPTP